MPKVKVKERSDVERAEELVIDTLASALDRVLDAEARARERHTRILESIAEAQRAQLDLQERQVLILERIAELQDRGLIAQIKGNKFARYGLYLAVGTTVLGGLIWFALEVLPQIIAWFSDSVATFPSRMTR